MINVDAEGFVRGFIVGERSYRELTNHPLSYSLAKPVLMCPEDAWRIHQRSERVEREQSDAMDGGSVLDALITADEPWRPEANPVLLWTANTKKATEPVEYSDWNGLRILGVDTLQTKAAKECAADARAKGLTPVKSSDFTEEVRRAEDLLVRMELAGFNPRSYQRQVSLYWTERARNGRVIQCRGRLDFLSHDWTSVVDLKRVESLDQLFLERAVDRYRWAMQAAAYSRAVMFVRHPNNTPVERGTDWSGPPSWRWLFARTSPVVACTMRPADSMLLEAGEAAWNRAVNDWAEGLATGLWRGHEADHTPLQPTSWAVEQMEADLV